MQITMESNMALLVICSREMQMYTQKPAYEYSQ